MPILPENRARYPEDWEEIRERILTRAGQRRSADGTIIEEARCENCGVINRSWVIRAPDGDYEYAMPEEEGAVKIALRIAHLDHRPETRDENMLRAWCQRDHNRYDIEHRTQTRRATREKGQLQLQVEG